MAIATFTIDLNGGDIETADTDLTYRIYGGINGYTTPIALPGSDTNDANVSVTAGVATITNVNIGSETSFKVGVVDGDGNESILSETYLTIVYETVGNLTAPLASNTLRAGLRAAQVTMPENGYIVSISVYQVDPTVAGKKLKGAIYSDSTDQPSSLLAETPEYPNTNTGWNTVVFNTPYYVASGTKIWLGTMSENVKYSYGTGAQLRASSTTTTYGAFPSTFTIQDTAPYNYSLYATYYA